MLTEADMIRIMEERYCPTESLSDAYSDDEFIDDEARLWYNSDEMAAICDYNLPFLQAEHTHGPNTA